MSDLVERLRDVAGFIQKEHGRVAAAACLATEAADRIEQLEAELTIQYQDGHHDGYEKGCTISKEASERYDRIEADNKRLQAALRKLTNHFEHGDEWSGETRSETISAVERFARAALKDAPA